MFSFRVKKNLIWKLTSNNSCEEGVVELKGNITLLNLVELEYKEAKIK